MGTMTPRKYYYVTWFYLFSNWHVSCAKLFFVQIKDCLVVNLKVERFIISSSSSFCRNVLQEICLPIEYHSQRSWATMDWCTWFWGYRFSSFSKTCLFMWFIINTPTYETQAKYAKVLCKIILIYRKFLLSKILSHLKQQYRTLSKKLRSFPWEIHHPRTGIDPSPMMPFEYPPHYNRSVDYQIQTFIYAAVFKT